VAPVRVTDAQQAKINRDLNTTTAAVFTGGLAGARLGPWVALAGAAAGLLVGTFLEKRNERLDREAAEADAKQNPASAPAKWQP
jgi:hypothetical protein